MRATVVAAAAICASLSSHAAGDGSGAARGPPAFRIERCDHIDYPSESVILGEQGTSTVGVRLGADGTLQEARIVTSSGHPRLDEAALRMFRSCRFRPAVEGQADTTSEIRIEYVWKLAR